MNKNQIKLKDNSVLDAIKILLNYPKHENKQSNLFSSIKNPFLYLTLLVNELPSIVNIKPVHIKLPNSIYGKKYSTRVCIILENSIYENNKEYLKHYGNNYFFISYDKLKKNYREYKDKRSLFKDYDLFYC